MAFDTETGRIREHGGHPGVCPDCPETCEVCDGTGWVHRLLRPMLTLLPSTYPGHIADCPVGATWHLAMISTDHIGDPIECHDCRGEGSVY